MLGQSFRVEVCLWLLDEIERLIRQHALATCIQCRDLKDMDSSHECFRIRTGQVRYEVLDVHNFYVRCLRIATDMIELDSYFPVISKIIKNELLKRDSQMLK